jgi:hypothetical protein
MKWKLYEDKTTLRQPNPGNPLSEDKASTNTVTLIYPYAAIVSCTLTHNPT